MQPDIGHPADPWAVIAGAVEFFRPADPLGLADWAAQHRWVGGSRAGRWNHETAPYLVDPMREVDDPGASAIVLPGPGRCGKTAIGENLLLRTIDTDPGPMGWYLNTDDVRTSYVKGTINPMLDMHEGAIGAKLLHGPTDNSLGFKRFRGGSVEFLVFTDSALRNKTFRIIFADEIDGYDDSVGDPMTQLDVRRATYGADSRIVLASHPDRAHGLDPLGWRRGIMRYYAMSSRGTWWWPCRKCGAFCSPNPGTPFHCALAWPDDAPIEEIAAAAHLLCPNPDCNAQLDDADRLAMNQDGVWVHAGQSINVDGKITGARRENPIRGFWIVGTMSPFLLHGIGGLAAARVRAERELAEGEDEAQGTLRTVLSKQWGWPLVLPKRLGTANVETLAERAEAGLRLGQVPEGVRFLTAAVDVQANRFELLVRGWGERLESWIIDVRQVRADTATDPEAWDELLAELLAAEYPLADGSGRVMRIRAVGYDSGGERGVTANAYDVWPRLKRRGLVRSYGLMGNRECWKLLPLRGSPLRDASRLIVRLPDGGRADKTTYLRRDCPLGVFNATIFKDALLAQLDRAEPGPLAVHLPAGLLGAWPAAPRTLEPPHRWLEQLFAEQRGADGRWKKIVSSAANEALDLMVMNGVVAHLHASRVDWKKAAGLGRRMGHEHDGRCTESEGFRGGGDRRAAAGTDRAGRRCALALRGDGMSDCVHEGPFAGMPRASVQAALAQAQQALISLGAGQLRATISYGMGGEQKSVTYTRTNQDALRVLIRDLQRALGMRAGRRPAMGVSFTGSGPRWHGYGKRIFS